MTHRKSVFRNKLSAALLGGVATLSIVGLSTAANARENAQRFQAEFHVIDHAGGGAKCETIDIPKGKQLLIETASMRVAADKDERPHAFILFGARTLRAELTYGHLNLSGQKRNWHQIWEPRIVVGHGVGQAGASDFSELKICTAALGSAGSAIPSVAQGFISGQLYDAEPVILGVSAP